MIKTHEIVCISESLSPISHMSGTEGNEAILNREAVATSQGVQWVPSLSGNAIRHKAVRAPGMRWLADAYGLSGSLTLAQYNYLFHGGALTLSTKVEDLARVADWQRLWPLGRLIGGCLPDQVLAGSLQTWRGVLACRENATAMRAILPPELIPDRPLRSAASLVDGWQYTRSGSASRNPDLLAEGQGAEGDLMIFAGQAVMRGAVWVHGFTLPHVSDVEVGALLWSLSLWQQEGGTIGGMSARGHGRLATSIVTDGLDVEGLIEGYKTYAMSVRDEAVAWLRDVFRKCDDKAAAKEEKKAAAKPKKAKPEPAAVEEPNLFGGSED